MPPRRLPSFLRPSELAALLEAAAKPRDRLILELGLFLGLRVSELRTLRIEHINLEESRVMVVQGKGCKDRALPLPDRLRPLLVAWVGERRDGLLIRSPRGDRPLTARAIQRLMKRLAVLAGIFEATKPRKATPHKLRHGYASRLLATGADLMVIKDLLGHESLATTQRYLHVDPDRLKAAVDRL